MLLSTEHSAESIDTEKYLPTLFKGNDLTSRFIAKVAKFSEKVGNAAKQYPHFEEVNSKDVLILHPVSP